MMLARFFTRIRPLALAAAGSVALGAQAMPLGIQVTKEQEAQVRTGMSMDDVRLVLGYPATHMKYRNEPGPTYTYRVAGNDDYLFDVDFDADGRVFAVSERMSDAGGGSGRRRGGR